MPSAASSAVTPASRRWPGVCCPACRGALDDHGERLGCLDCGKRFPLRDGVPVLLDPERSLFEPEVPAPRKPPGALRAFALSLLPSLSANPVSQRNYVRLVRSALARAARPRVLVVGGGRAGQGMAPALADERIEWVETDVSPSERTAMLCDAQQIPFADATFDAVVAQAVLEHVADPGCAVDEIWYCLRFVVRREDRAAWPSDGA